MNDIYTGLIPLNLNLNLNFSHTLNIKLNLIEIFNQRFGLT